MQARAEEQRLRVEKQKAEREDRDRERKAKAEQARLDKERLEMERLARREAEAAEQVPSLPASNSASPLSNLVPPSPCASSPLGLCSRMMGTSLASTSTRDRANCCSCHCCRHDKKGDLQTLRNEKAVLP